MEIERRYQAFEALSFGLVPKSVLKFNLYGLRKLEKSFHLDNLDFLYDVLTNIEGINKKYLRLCRTFADFLQLSILEVDDTLDHLPKTDMETLASESMKALNPVIFFNSMMSELERNPENLDRFAKAVKSYLKSVGDLFNTPVEYIKNRDGYLKANSKQEEYDRLATTQILRGSHLRVYFYPCVYIIDPQPLRKEIERLAYLAERTRGIGLLRKDIYDRKDDLKYGNYNAINLIVSKYSDSANLNSIVCRDIASVGRMLLEDVIKNANDVRKKYRRSAKNLIKKAEESIVDLEENLERF
ncbi:MAG: hypothetical protein PHD13_04185 [Methanocellales archaeon]|nr:hypothetical protein [Methanocellales archaeon]MDD3292116.1 hypothetical protein [Methanocellales archaeon]MDD5235353.1 hypothetical protein [Methanocellales archaeon]MDD5485699.1 hypothetical protein [Methanocellales archaeon]